MYIRRGYVQWRLSRSYEQIQTTFKAVQVSQLLVEKEKRPIFDWQDEIDL
jgi:hypothetical protein